MRPFNKDAVQKIFQAKKRTKFGPLTLYLASIQEISKYTLPTFGFSIGIAHTLWPGEVSFILYKQSIISNAVTCGANTVAVACHAHPVLQGVIAAFGKPVCGSSANLSGQGDIYVTVEKAIIDLSSEVDLILDDGPTPAAHHLLNIKVIVLSILVLSLLFL
jgi:L-threonylcarbamoyladenylate synthase